MAEYDVDSDESSVQAPPPPPPAVPIEEKKSTDLSRRTSTHPYESKLKVFQGLAEFRNDTELEGGEDEAMISHDEHYDDHTADYISKYRKRSGRRENVKYCSIALCLIAIIAIVIGAGVGSGALKKSSSSAAATPGTGSNPSSTGGSTQYFDSSGRTKRIYDYLVTVVVGGDSAFTDPASPESQALVWLQYSISWRL